MICSLCFERNKLWETSDEYTDSRKNILKLIQKYINLDLDDISIICVDCVNHLHTWNKFYVKIFSVRDSSKKHEFVLENVSDKDNKINEQKDVIKLERKLSNLNQREVKDIKSNIKNINYNEPASKTNEGLPSQTQTDVQFDYLKIISKFEDEIDMKLSQYINNKCNFCEEILPSFKKLLKHISFIHKTKGFASCCNIKLFSRTIAIEHINSHHSKIQNLYKCLECQSQFFNLITLNNHRISKHNTDKLELFPCILCDNTSFSRVYLLKKHMNETHVKSESFKCAECPKKFQKYEKLRDHISRVHSSNIPDHICDICGLVFKTKCGFKNHRNEIHLGIVKPKEKCEICGNYVKCLKKHKYMTHPPENVIIKCDLCNKRISTWNALYNHKQHAHGEKKFSCQICMKAFKELKLLKEHVASHTGQPLYQCAYCPTTFKCEANYFKHRKRIHQEEMKKDKRAKINLD